MDRATTHSIERPGARAGTGSAPRPVDASSPHAQAPLLKSLFIGGFECSTHLLRSGKRLDLLAATGHDRYAAQDYARMKEQGILTAREGVRWHLIERTPGRFDWSSALPMVRAAEQAGIQVLWDLWHYGWPEDLDIFSTEFARRFSRFARAFAHIVREESDGPYFFTPMNEMSFFSWAAGGAAWMHPYAPGRGDELKQQTVRATIEAIEALWEVIPGARIVHTDPLINVILDPERPGDRPFAEGHHEAQFQAWDMLSGRRWTYLGGHPRYLDILGCNYYADNQWIHAGPPVRRDHPLYRPFRELLVAAHERYGRPIIIAETGIEGDERPDWLRYIGEEVRAARAAGAPVEGICLYPVLDYPGWDDDRHCTSGLWGYPDARGRRRLYAPLAEEMRRQERLILGGVGEDEDDEAA